MIGRQNLVGVVATWVACVDYLVAQQLYVHFIAPTGYWEKKVSKLDGYLQKYGAPSLVEPKLFYSLGSITSETAKANDVLERVRRKPNSPTTKHVLIVYPEAALATGDYSMYQPLIDSGTLIIWFSQYLFNGNVGPNGTIVFSPDDYGGGWFVAERFCILAAPDANAKRIAVISIPGAFWSVKGFQEGIANFCGAKGHQLELVPITTNRSASNNEGMIQAPTATSMNKMFALHPSFSAVFSPSQYVTRGVIEAVNLTRASSTNVDGLGGLLLNGWHNKLKTELAQSKTYADVDRARSSHLSEGVARFIRFVNLSSELPMEVRTPIKERVPAMDGFVKGKLLNLYDKSAAPPAITTDAKAGVVVDINMIVKGLFFVDNDHKQITVTLDVLVEWRDLRLGFNKDDYDGILRFNKNQIWYPNIEIQNLVKTVEKFWHTMESNSTGHVVLTEHSSMILNCPTYNLANFPSDSQKCPVTFVSNMAAGMLQLSEDRERGYDSALEGGGFTVNAVTHGGTDSEVVYTIRMARIRGVYFLTHQIPGIMFVGLGFLSMWIPPGAVPARVALGVIMLLTTLTLWTSLPRAGTLMDKWFIANLAFQVISFLVSVMSSNPKINLCCWTCLRKLPDPYDLIHDEEDVIHDEEDEDQKVKAQPKSKPTCRYQCISCLCGHRSDPPIDQWARRLVPLAYCVVTAMFFTVMAQSEEGDNTGSVTGLLILGGIIIYALMVMGTVCCVHQCERIESKRMLPEANNKANSEGRPDQNQDFQACEMQQGIEN